MTIISEAEELDRDYLWFATDQVGHVAALHSGGSHIHRVVKQSEECLFACHKRVFQLPTYTKGKFDAAFAKRVSGNLYPGMTFTEATKVHRQLARKGLFVYMPGYDPDVCQPYQRVAVPMRPVQLDELPQEIADYLRPIQIPVKFETAIVIELDCIQR